MPLQGPIPITHPHPGEEAMVAGQLGATTWVGKLRFHKFWEVFFWKVLSESRSKGRYKKHPTVSNSQVYLENSFIYFDCFYNWCSCVKSSANTALAEPHPVELSLKILRCLLFCCSALPDWRPRSLRPRWVSRWEEPEIWAKSKEVLYQLEIVA